MKPPSIAADIGFDCIQTIALCTFHCWLPHLITRSLYLQEFKVSLQKFQRRMRTSRVWNWKRKLRTFHYQIDLELSVSMILVHVLVGRDRRWESASHVIWHNIWSALTCRRRLLTLITAIQWKIPTTGHSWERGMYWPCSLFVSQVLQWRCFELSDHLLVRGKNTNLNETMKKILSVLREMK